MPAADGTLQLNLHRRCLPSGRFGASPEESNHGKGDQIAQKTTHVHHTIVSSQFTISIGFFLKNLFRGGNRVVVIITLRADDGMKRKLS
jgi:hypothetical protein